MLIENLGNLKWKCYTKEGYAEIYADRDEDRIGNDNRYATEMLNSNAHSHLVDIIEELYYLVALETIDSNDNIKDKEIRLLQLEQMEQKYNALLRLKQMYYTEVQESIKCINNFGKCEELIDNEMLSLIKELLQSFYECYKYKYFHRRTVVDYYQLLDLHLMNPKLFKALFEAIMDIEICSYKHDVCDYNVACIKEWFKLFVVLRDKTFGIVGEMAWLSFLLIIFQHACSDSCDFEWLKIESELDWKEKLVRNIKQTSSVVENTLGSKICDMQKDMLMCYLQKPMVSDIFDKKIERLVEALKQLSKMKEYEGVLNRYFNKKGKGCIAIMHSNSKRYVALSGGEYVNKYSADLKRILGSEYKVVELNSAVRYYQTKQAYITYEQYNIWKNNVGFDESKVTEIDRMFSCCERKLLTELYGKGNINYTIYVKMKVCNMCNRALESFDLTQNCHGLIKYPIVNKIRKSCSRHNSLNYKLNEVAKGVRKGTLPDESIY